MSGGIQLTQGGVAQNTAGVAHPAPISVDPGKLCYLAFVGSVAPPGIYTWAIAATGDPHAVISSASSPGPTFSPVTGADYTITLTDEHGALYQLDIGVAVAPSASSVTFGEPRSIKEFGAKVDGREVSDGVVTAGSKTLTSATAAFTAADVGKSALLRTPSNPCPGTVTVTIGSQVVVGSGCAFLTNIPTTGSIPSSGGGCYIDGTYYAILVVIDNNNVQLCQVPAVGAIAKTLYREIQLATTIAAYVSPTQVTLADTVAVSGTSIHALIATDDTVSVDLAITTAIAQGKSLTTPSGLCGMSQNLYYANVAGLVIAGQSQATSAFVDLRKCSDQTLVAARTRKDYGLLSFITSDSITLRDFAIDGSVPVIGIGHSTGGVINNSGGRAGVYMEDVANSTISIGNRGFGARDEHRYADSSSVSWLATNLIYRDCVDVNACNGPSVNPGGVGRVNIEDCILRSAFACIECAAVTATISGGQMSNDPGFPTGSEIMELFQASGGSSMHVHGVTLIGSDTRQGAVSLINYDGQFGDSACSLLIEDMTVVGNTGYYYNQSSALFRVYNCRGTATIRNINFDRNVAAASGGTFIRVEGSLTGKVIIGPNIYRGRAGSNMTRAVVVWSDAGTPTFVVPDRAVTILPGSFFGESVTTALDAGTVICDTATQMPGAPLGTIIENGSGSPEGVVTALPGSWYYDRTGAAYIKTSGSGNTNWKAVSHA